VKEDVLALAQALANMQASPTTLDQMYDDAMLDVAGQALFNVVELVAATPGQAVYPRPLGMTDILTVFYDDSMLSLVTLRELEATHPDWRSRQGRPVAWLIEDQSNDEFRLYPAPLRAPDPVIPLHGAPFGLDYPRDTIAVLGSQARRDLPDWLDLPLAFLVVAREFSRASPHADKAFSAVCRQLGGLYLGMVV
jgi:hypothetical protein